ncbi:MAG TPA: gamma-glutamyl-gamma-aminobutyrate hydrolase family protein [Rubricoccaceae bacterium]|nr:gamma-glutamyl-gamma-aminobutyrate hydrolase family protein [Rubricoccaceae bacterium]
MTPGSSRPRIGVSTSFEEGQQRLDLAYVRAVEAAGGLPLVAPMLDTEEATADFAALLDGLIITGGPAVTLGLVGDLPFDLPFPDPVRVASDTQLLRAFMETRRPVLGICYGMQFASSLLGGTIWADVQAQRPGSVVHSNKRGGSAHALRIEAGSHLHRVLGDAVEVPTHHIQAIERPGRGLRVSALSPDGVIEALENEDGSFVGVQFHPERMGAAGAPLFQDLVERARRARR